MSVLERERSNDVLLVANHYSPSGVGSISADFVIKFIHSQRVRKQDWTLLFTIEKFDEIDDWVILHLLNIN